jgi:uncharacterized membrane protein
VTPSYIVWAVWFALFATLELISVFWAGCPWRTLSRTVWNLQQNHEWLTVPLIAGLAVLSVHLIRGRSVQEGDSANKEAT